MQRRAVKRRRAGRQRSRRASAFDVARKRGRPASADPPVRPVKSTGVVASVANGAWAGHQSAVVSPVESEPGPALERLVLRRAWSARTSRRGRCGRPIPRARKACASSANLRIEEARRDVGEDDECRQAVKIREAAANGKARYFGIVPLDGKGDGRIAEDAEIVGVVRVFPDVFAAQHEVLPEGLLQAGVKFVAPSRAQQPGNRRRNTEKRRSATGEQHPVLERMRFSLNGVSMVRA